jgi:hypothetical protein
MPHAFLRSALLVAALAGCATAAEPGPQERVTRNTTVIATVDAGGRSRVTPITTTSYTGPREAALESPADVVFAALGAVYQDMGIPVGTIDTPNRTTGNTQVRARGRLGRHPVSTYLDCGQTGLRGPAADAYPVRISVLSTVVPAGQGSRLRTLVEAGYTAAEASGTVACTSTGELEAAIARAVTVRTAS